MKLMFAHFLSCNIGDRYQAYYLYQLLLRRYHAVNVYAVNFIEFHPSPLKTDVYEHLWIHSPDKLPDAPLETTVILTGSMDKYCNYVKYIPALVHQSKRVIIWGGLTRSFQSFQTFIKGLEFFHAPNVSYYARSERDLLLYKQMGGRQGVLAGDPLAPLALLTPFAIHRNFNPLAPLNQQQSTQWQGHMIFILSKYAVNKCASVCTKIQTFLPEMRTIGFDSSIDREITDECFQEIEPLLQTLLQARVIISTRLHGAILGAMLHVPTLLIDISNDPDGLGAFKFKAIGYHACGFNKGLVDTINIKDVELLLDVGEFDQYIDSVIEQHDRRYFENEKEYLKRSMKSYQRLMEFFVL